MQGQSQAGDVEWIRRLRQGDEAAFTAIYQNCSGSVYRFALYMTGDRNMAEEITQDTFLFLLAHTSSFDAARGSLLGWLLGVARNGSRRAMAATDEADSLDELSEIEVPGEGDLFEEFAQRELIEAVRRGVGSLPPSLREVVILCDLQELDYREAAAVLGCPIGTIRSRVHRARALLISKLKTRCSA